MTQELSNDLRYATLAIAPSPAEASQPESQGVQPNKAIGVALMINRVLLEGGNLRIIER
jgi:hypothetical protein